MKKLAVPYDYYRIFYYVAQHKSFTKAAEALVVTELPTSKLQSF